MEVAQMAEAEVLYEELDDVAVITLNRPDKMNTLNEAVIQGLADAVGRASESVEARAIVLRGAGRTFTAGYDLDFGARSPGFSVHGYGAAPAEPRPGAWDPVRDYHMM